MEASKQFNWKKAEVRHTKNIFIGCFIFGELSLFRFKVIPEACGSCLIKSSHRCHAITNQICQNMLQWKFSRVYFPSVSQCFIDSFFRAKTPPSQYTRRDDKECFGKMLGNRNPQDCTSIFEKKQPVVGVRGGAEAISYTANIWSEKIVKSSGN